MPARKHCTCALGASWAPKRHQGAPKRRPGAPKRLPRGAGTLPRGAWSQDAAGRSHEAPGCSQEAPGRSGFSVRLQSLLEVTVQKCILRKLSRRHCTPGSHRSASLHSVHVYVRVHTSIYIYIYIYIYKGAQLSLIHISVCGLTLGSFPSSLTRLAYKGSYSMSLSSV